MSAVAVVLLEIFCCLGFGAAALRLLKIDTETTPGEYWGIAFAIGFGVLGWFLFPLGVAGYLSDGPLTTLLTVGALAAVLLRRSGGSFASHRPDIAGKILITILGVVFLFDLVEAMAPPADADTLAYQFNIPRLFLESGRIEFIPLPLEGAVPFLVQMTYVPALKLGGESALTLWTMVSGWAAAFLLFCLCRRHLGLNWSLAVMLIFLTTPSVIYGGGTGQVEVRLSLFVMVAAWAVMRATGTGQIAYVVLAALGSGFYAAGKYTGLLFAAVVGSVFLFQRHRLTHGAVYAGIVVAAGFQWYAWNAIHTGDPVFPMLFQWLGREDLGLWTKTYDMFFKQGYFSGETPMPKTPLGLILYPFSVTLGFGDPVDAGRVGWGPYHLLLMPFAAAGVWRFRHRLRRSPLLVYALLAIVFYVIWFFLGGSQRIRHLVPILPLVLICVTTAAGRFVIGREHREPLLAAMAVTIFLQVAAHGLFASNYFRFLFVDADRHAFLARNVDGYSTTHWINANLVETDRIFIRMRQLRYFLKVPYLTTHNFRGAVDLRPEVANVQTLYRQFRAAGVTHFLLMRKNDNDFARYAAPFGLLQQAGCLALLKSFAAQRVSSRTLPALHPATWTLDVLKLKGEICLR